MGIGSLYPALRSNNAFSGTFFLTRVFFHLTLLLINGSEHGRHAHGVNGSWGPTICLAVTYPMHLWWGYKCVMSIRRRMLKRRLERKKVQQQQSSVAEGAGAAFLGLPAPDTTSTLNTPAITPVSTPGAVPAIANFGSSGPVHAAFARAAAAAPRPMNFFNARRERNLRQNSSQVARQRPFTAPVAPAGAAADAREPFLDIRSPAETRDRARRLVADAVRKAWASAPESWRKQFALEATASGRRGSSDESGSSSEGESLRPSSGPRDRRAAARRAVMRAVRRAINGRDVENEEEVEAAADELASPNGLDRTLAGLDFSALIDLLPPDFKGQDFEVRPVSVERDVVGGRRKRIVGQIRRRMEVARREVVVFD